MYTVTEPVTHPGRALRLRILLLILILLALVTLSFVTSAAGGQVVTEFPIGANLTGTLESVAEISAF